ncbi:hypothetical protein P7K49_009331 [Saguinus oedipus]|uniref:Uncharacterized protein n=1 Tax=Saguinus oedipus TaxID=9490 RepID=A0ABQ9VKA3_SAGOE|nr:hypothetical protein P7K49_009331 [Saguinus oedipus]
MGQDPGTGFPATEHTSGPASLVGPERVPSLPHRYPPPDSAFAAVPPPPRAGSDSHRLVSAAPACGSWEEEVAIGEKWSRQATPPDPSNSQGSARSIRAATYASPPLVLAATSESGSLGPAAYLARARGCYSALPSHRVAARSVRDAELLSKPAPSRTRFLPRSSSWAPCRATSTERMCIHLSLRDMQMEYKDASEPAVYEALAPWPHWDSSQGERLRALGSTQIPKARVWSHGLPPCHDRLGALLTGPPHHRNYGRRP